MRDLPSIFPDVARREALEVWSRVRDEMADPHSDLNQRRRLTTESRSLLAPDRALIEAVERIEEES